MYVGMCRASDMVVGLSTRDLPMGQIQYIGDGRLRCVEILD
jgi:hypothetical protein